VTERATDRISSYAVGPDGSADGPTVIASSAATPYGFDFTRTGVLVVTEAAAGKLGAASASTDALAGRARCRWSAARSVTPAVRSAERRSAPTTALSM
jgi:hypothetical protein